LTVLLCKADGTSLGSTDIKVDSGGKWRKITGSLTATGSDPKAWIRIISDRAGKLTVDCVSLFPPTYKDRVNGCRPDLAQMLADMKPAFVRFPGGCYVEGTGGEQNRFIWKNTIGPIEERPGHWNGNWGYRSSDGFGFHEMLQLTEDLGAEPLFVVNIGMGHGWQYAYDDIDFFIQEALDAIEYCNGDESTKWGKMRAENGHPEPFGLRLLEIGNENYQQNPNEQSDHYAERYKQFYDAIKAVYPDMVLIGNVESWGTDSPSWRNPYPCEVVDEHYYRNPGWFENMYAKYDNYDRSKPKVYVGEYAVTQDFGTNGHLEAALGEATYMLGMENNSDVCVMNSYAPIFVNENDQKWMPDMIRFNSEMAYGTPSYHVQSLMANLHGKQNVKWTETGNLVGSGNKMGLSTWSTAATFDNVKVTAATGVVFSDDFSKNEGWTSKGGSWSVADGALKQTDASMQGKIYVCDTELPDSYTLELDATKDSGAEGFLIAFNYADDKNYCWWNLGGWGNASHGIEVCTNGSKSTYDRRDGKLVNGKTYHLKIEVAGEKVKCYIDGELIHDVTLPAKRKVYFASSIDQEAGLLYVKVVNNSGDAQEVTLSLAGGSFDGVEDITVLASASNKDENDNDNRTRVAPAAGAIDRIEASKAVYTVPAYSLNILRLRVSDIAAVEPGKPATDEQKAAMSEFLAPLAQKLGWLHASTALPTGTSDGATIKWQLSGASKTSLSDGLWATTLVVSKLSDKEENDGTLKALVTFPTGEEATFELPVRLAASDGMYGYLYT
ncbi:MAG: hypothetical protein K2F91_02830, partial [Muribaculaceae bacterium]|nr:hypothetical protein [Muribaculaceae bacterium]